jgi:hypothetical protein
MQVTPDALPHEHTGCDELIVVRSEKTQRDHNVVAVHLAKRCAGV